MQTQNLLRLTIAVGIIATLTLCGCVRTVYVERAPQSLRCIRMERNGVSGVWMPDPWFRSIRSASTCMLDLMREAEVEADQ